MDLGCGAYKIPGTIGVDQIALPGVDHVVDLDTQPLPFPDDSVSYIFSSHTLEHLREVSHLLLHEIPRVVRHGPPFEMWAPRLTQRRPRVRPHARVERGALPAHGP